jgi:dynein heavy chain
VLAVSDKIVEVGERAAKEYVIEVSLEKMKSEWESISFEVIAYRPVKDGKPESNQNFIIRTYE